MSELGLTAALTESPQTFGFCHARLHNLCCIFSSTIGEVSQSFHVSAEVGILGISLYVLGFAFGKTTVHLSAPPSI
jgi:hypothetical protein